MNPRPDRCITWQWAARGNELAANLTTLSQQAYSPSYRNIMLGLRLVYERTAKLEDREI